MFINCCDYPFRLLMNGLNCFTHGTQRNHHAERSLDRINYYLIYRIPPRQSCEAVFESPPSFSYVPMILLCLNKVYVHVYVSFVLSTSVFDTTIQTRHVFVFQLQKFKYFADDVSKLDKADRFCYEVYLCCILASVL